MSILPGEPLPDRLQRLPLVPYVVVLLVAGRARGPKGPGTRLLRAMSAGGGTTGAKHLWVQLSSIRHPLDGEPPGALVPGLSSAAKPLHPTLYLHERWGGRTVKCAGDTPTKGVVAPKAPNHLRLVRRVWGTNVTGWLPSQVQGCVH